MSGVHWSEFTNVGSFTNTDILVGMRTINGTLTNVAFNGTALSTVSTVTGTANEIIVSPTSGNVVVALASNAVLPGTGGITLPTGNVAQRLGSAGTIRFNSQIGVFEATADGSNWATIETSLTTVTAVTATYPLISTGGNTPNISMNGISDIAQGDLLYGSALHTVARLSKDTNATRYLSNTGSSNNPAWAQVNLTNGVTGILPDTNGGTGLTVANNSPAQGRLTLTTNSPVTTGDVTAATTIYYTPYVGNWIALYTSGAWKSYTFSQISLSVPNTTSTMYDVFAFDSLGSVTLEATAWTNDTTRATALVYQDGVYCKTGSLGHRYLGSFRTTGVSGQTEDSVANRFLWNYYNRIHKQMQALEATTSWNYTTAAYRQANASTSNQLNFIVGVSEDILESTAYSSCSNSGTGAQVSVGIGLDSTTVNSAQLQAYDNLANAIALTFIQSVYRGYPGIGKHSLVWLEYSTASGTTTWYGAGGASPLQTGINGSGKF